MKKLVLILASIAAIASSCTKIEYYLSVDFNVLDNYEVFPSSEIVVPFTLLSNAEKFSVDESHTGDIISVEVRLPEGSKNGEMVINIGNDLWDETYVILYVTGADKVDSKKLTLRSCSLSYTTVDPSAQVPNFINPDEARVFFPGESGYSNWTSQLKSPYLLPEHRQITIQTRGSDAVVFRNLGGIEKINLAKY